MKTNADVNVKNQLTKECVKKYLEDKCRCQCKESTDKGMCEKIFIWNPSNCGCECDKSCDVGEYLDYKSCNCRKRKIDKLVEECSKNIIETETIDIIPLNVIPLNVYKKYVILVCYIWYYLLYS